MRKRTTITGAVVVALACTTGLGTIAFATPGSGNVVQTDVASGTLDGTDRGPAKVTQDGVELKTKSETQVTTFDLTYPPGSFSGWHSHPGIVIVVVKSGSVLRQTDCGPGSLFEVGDAFTEVGPHYVTNPGSEPAVLSITRVYPASATAARIDEPAPVCP